MVGYVIRVSASEKSSNMYCIDEWHMAEDDMLKHVQEKERYTAHRPTKTKSKALAS
ncbi:hypothetical protein [Oryza sativa Japonica Group]|uniref:Uncharacterized protein n=1 Tax=Oryza sativa subsp. japonica TaxID=39947 RepID=Q9LGU3_ORYSJ|nr:hypothetical protein [Oryza sativa Japonica Group]